MPKDLKRPFFFAQFTLLLIVLTSCAPEQPKKEEVLFQQYCASCHIAPKIESLPKGIWRDAVLPDMASRMEIEEMYQDPNEVKPGFRPKIKLADWLSLQNYIVELAPERLEPSPVPKQDSLGLFNPKTVSLDGQNGALITYLEWNTAHNRLFYGDISGKLAAYDYPSNSSHKTFQGQTPITWYNSKDSVQMVTEVGILDPSELEQGKMTVIKDVDTLALSNPFHRPVHTLMEDLNGDGNLELVVSEFGNETGQLSLLTKAENGQYDKKTLLNLPGAIRTLAKDMDKDGRLDLISIFSQGNENVTIFYQTGDLDFRAEKVLEFSPVYGSSWFELVDYNGDGHDDIITVNGDNADKSYVHKPYHGMRIHLNDGNNNFSEAFFYPLYGATRLLARDFDQDGDYDFGLISSFPDYEKHPELSFVYLENIDSNNFQFSTQTLENPNASRWFLMDAADIDGDGDEDLLLSAFTYVFTPVPEELSEQWSQGNVDLLVLENKLK